MLKKFEMDPGTGRPYHDAAAPGRQPRVFANRAFSDAGLGYLAEAILPSRRLSPGP